MADFLQNKSENLIIKMTNIADGDTDFIPLMSSDDEKNMRNEEVPEELPILPLRNTVLFPGVVLPITVGRDKSIRLIRDYYNGNRRIGVVTQLDSSEEEPNFEDLYKVGTMAQILRTLQMPDGNTTVILQGKRNFRMNYLVSNEPYMMSNISPVDSTELYMTDIDTDVLISSLKDTSIQIIKKSPNMPSEAEFAIKNIDSPHFLINFISSNLKSEVPVKQKLLEMTDMLERGREVLSLLVQEMQMLELQNKIQSKVKVEMDKQQRDYMLHQQMKTIQEELGDNPHEQAVHEFEEKAAKKKWGKPVQEVFERELKKLQRMNPIAAEYSIQLNYLDTLVSLPWNECSKDNLDLKHARKVLDEDHYGLEKVKERILEYLAVLKLKGDMRSPILCLVGPPGVGKTSLGKSLARSIGRKYVRMSLGGLRDEAEIRGHRKTYIGAMPGRIIQNLKKVKTSNPVFVLDEVDKIIGSNINGDPASALLEVLDPEQNNTFYDNFLEIEYDLSRIMFVATANTLSTIHPALRDRMEIIDISGYLMEEKLEIARRHLIPRQLEYHGVDKKQLSIPKATLSKVIEDYTRESGVRSLDKAIAKIIRYNARFIAEGEDYEQKVSAKSLQDILGVPRFQRDSSVAYDRPGVVTGLAWTQVGGEILYVEASLSRGNGRLSITGNLGDVMKESATLAYEYLKSNAEAVGVNPKVFRYWNVHIHVPEGATPKDGPSAGITMFTALASVFTQRKVNPKYAMTGEITLRGRVLPVGGIKEKILAAKRVKVSDIVISIDNQKDILDIREDYIKGLEFHYVRNMIDVLDYALMSKPVADALNIEKVLEEEKKAEQD